MEQIVKEFLQKGYLIDQNLTKLIDNPTIYEIQSYFIELIISLQPAKIISKDFFFNNIDSILKGFEVKSKTAENKEKFFEAFNYLKQFSFSHEIKSSLELEREKEKEQNEEKMRETSLKGVRVVESFSVENRKVSVEDFVRYFRDRYNVIKPFLLEHDLKNLTSINKLSGQRQNVTIIGLVYAKHHTKNKNLLLEIEDLTGKITVLIRKDKEELFKKAQEIVLDEVIAISCSGSSDILFANDFVFPESILKERKKAEKEEFAIFTADLHVGSNKFLEENFLKFVEWLNGNLGNDNQKKIAKKIKYMFIDGDLVDGVGIYPGQEAELFIKDIYAQYDKVAELLGKIRKDLTIIICPGNHDAVRIIEPQPVFNRDIAKKLYELENVLILTNPSTTNIGSTKDFSGFNVFMYHGSSFDYYANDVDFLRVQSPYKRPELITDFLLKKRHIAPTHTSSLYFPCERDSLILRKIPDIFVSAHIHKSSISRHNNILVISCSCWQARTAYQEKFGHEPDPCKVPIFDLKTGKVNVIDFS